MVSFSSFDLIIIILFFVLVLSIGFIVGRRSKNNAEDYLLSGRKVGLFLFILTNVATWYGGILGVGEFVYRYGVVSWFTQGFPYYIFAFLFAIFFAKKIREASLFTIPDKLNLVYGKKVGLASAVLVFTLVSPAPYLLMTGSLISLIFDTNIFIGLVSALVLSIAYLFRGGFRSDVYTDVIQFFVMFIGFILIVIFSYATLGGLSFLQDNLPQDHLKLTGTASPGFICVWFLIALWTFADPGFHQRSYAAKSGSIAVKGIIISILFWLLFDALTTTTGLYARAYLPTLSNPSLSYPLLAEAILPSGIKGIFYAALFATIMSTANSFLFLSATTISRDFMFKLSRTPDEKKLKIFAIYGLIISGIASVALAYFIPSVIEIWYTIGSICIPGVILPVVSSYYAKLKIGNKFVLIEMILSVSSGFIWVFIRQNFKGVFLLQDLEPMIVGLGFSFLIHTYGLLRNKFFSFNQRY
jgi:solute:Na+ symporter, SSS family